MDAVKSSPGKLYHMVLLVQMLCKIVTVSSQHGYLELRKGQANLGIVIWNATGLHLWFLMHAHKMFVS